ncbi:hypothetical protein GIB67_036639 [Kingdonia uniflora]|uniref:Uncharacterized protein n=1 Tax=Kingdonia uniflora TaxID=39325 RepID=A0A7J7LWL2_9MAGN|nr:hypothetical protein GIB67_036639 [Kingdonia uniflora]
MAASGSAYVDVMEIPACAVGTSSSLVWRPTMKKTVLPSEQTTPVQIPPVGTEGVVADVNMPPLKKQKKESGKGIRASSKDVNLEAVGQELFVSWKSAAEVLKLAAANREGAVREGEGTAEGAVREGSFRYKYGEIVFPGNDASLVAGDLTKEEVVHLRGKVIEMEKALSRVRDPINRTQQVHNKLEYERRLHKLNFAKTFKELFKLQCRYGKIKIERDEVLRKETDRTTLLNSKLQSEILELPSRLNVVIVELSCKDAKILTANNESKQWKESLKKKKSKTMAANHQVLDSEIHYMRERLEKLNWDLREARDSCQRKNDHAKIHEDACSKRDRKLNEAINKYNLRIGDLDRDKQALLQECIQGNEVFEELHAK